MELNKYQKEAVNSVDGNIAVVAAAGSGKSRVLVDRIAHMINDCDINSKNILAITFSKTAAENMKDRIAKIVDPNNLPNIGTCHSLGLSIIKQFQPSIMNKGLASDYWIKSTIIDICVKKLCLLKNNDMVPHARIKNYIDYQKLFLVGPDDEQNFFNCEDSMLSENDYHNIYKLYEKAKEEAKMIDYTDMLFRAYKLLKENEDIRKYYQDKFKYLLVDEAQDCNLLQIELIRLINTTNVFFVFDYRQAIYGFIYSSPEYVLNFEKYFPNSKYLNLPINYRCSKNIVDYSNKLISNGDESKHESYTDSIAHKEEFKDPVYEEYISQQSEAEEISNRIFELVNNKTYNYKDFAILLRINAQSTVIQSIFTKNEVPFELIGVDNFFERKEIRDTLNFLKVIHSGDSIAFKSIYNTPSRYLGKAFLEDLDKFSKIKGLGIVDSLRSYERQCTWRYLKGVTKLNEIIKKAKAKLKNNDVGIVIDTILDVSGYIDYIKNEYEDEGRIENLKSLMDQAKNYNDVGVFLEDIQKILEYSNSKKNSKDNEEADAVKILTVHKSKGLEFPVIFVVSMNDGVFPHKRSEVAEERRLAYVAVTRAEKELFISSTQMYNDSLCTPSQFIYEMDLI